MAAAMPTGLERYEMNKILCKTLQGRLYKGRDLVDNTTVGVKEAFKVLVSTGRSRDGSPVSEHFPTESRIHHAISQYDDMPRSILTLLDSWESDDSLFVALEWADGGEMFDYVKEAMTKAQRDISERVSKQEQIPAREMNEWQRASKNIFKQLVEGVAWLHSKGYSHRDLSLENTLMANKENTRIKIIDFGVAQEYAEGNFRCEPGRVGKLGYMAPEVYARQPYDARAADVWSLGVMLFMLLVGCPPYSVPRAGDQAFSFIYRGELQFVLKHWKRLPMVPHEALDLLERIFKPESHRITMEEIWHHDFVQIPDAFPTFIGPARYETEEAAQIFKQVSSSHTEEELYRIQKDVEDRINEITLVLEEQEESEQKARESVVDRPSGVVERPAGGGEETDVSFLKKRMNELKYLDGIIKNKMSSMFSRFSRTPNEENATDTNT